MEHLLIYIENHGIALVVLGFVIYFGVQYIKKNMNKVQCIHQQEFKELLENSRENKRLNNELKSLLQGFLFSFKYKSDGEKE